MARKDRDIFVVLAAVAAVAALIVLFNAPTPNSIESPTAARVARETGEDDEDDGSCATFSFNTDGTCDNDGDASTGMGRVLEQEERKRGKGKKKAPAVAIDLSSADAQSQVEALSAKMEKLLNNFHRKVEYSYVAQRDPGASSFGYGDAGVSSSTEAAWDALMAKGGANCGYGSSGRVSGNTKAVYMLMPSDMAYVDSSSGVNNADVFNAYVSFMSSMESHLGATDAAVHVGTYASNSAVRVYDLKGTSAAEKMTSLMTGLTVSARGSTLRVQQPDLGRVMGKFLTATKKVTRRDMDGAIGDSCFAVMLIHTLSKDYKNFAQGTFDNSFNTKCTVVPVFISPRASQDAFFTTMAANFAPNGENMDFTNAEAGLRPFHMMSMSAGLEGQLTDLADQIVSYMCGVENRVQCFGSSAAWFDAEVAMDRQATTTDGTTTSAFTSTTTTEGTTSVATTSTEGPSTSATTAMDPDMQCCGCGNGGASYDANASICSVCDGSWVVGEC